MGPQPADWTTDLERLPVVRKTLFFFIQSSPQLPLSVSLAHTHQHPAHLDLPARWLLPPADCNSQSLVLLPQYLNFVYLFVNLFIVYLFIGWCICFPAAN